MYAYACAHIHTPISIQVHKHGRLWLRFHYVWWFILTNNKQSEHLGGPGHASDGDFLPVEILWKTVDFERPGGREWFPSGTRSSFDALFLEAFSDPRVYRYPAPLCSEVFFFAASTKRCSKAPAGYAGWGLLKDPLLHVLPPQLTKQKSKDQKHRKFC